MIKNPTIGRSKKKKVRGAKLKEIFKKSKILIIL
jgi:hypothetical protein